MDYPDIQGFGMRLKEAREHAGYTGADLAKGIQPGGKDGSRQTISDWEKERHFPNAWQLALICRRLHVSADYLLFGLAANNENLKKARQAVEELSEEERRALFASMNGPGIPDHIVEERMPVTRKRTHQND